MSETMECRYGMHKLCKETCKLGKCRCECHERQLMEVLQDDAKRHEL